MTRTRKLTFSALFAAISAILMYIEFPILPAYPFLKIDLSGAVILLGAFIFGLAPAFAMLLVKDGIHLLQTQTGGAGELSDFLVLGVFITVSVLIYRMHKTRQNALLGCVFGTVIMAIIGIFTNRFLILPIYGMNAVPDVNLYLIYGVLPFNLIKGAILTLITMLLYKKLSILIKSK